MNARIKIIMSAPLSLPDEDQQANEGRLPLLISIQRAPAESRAPRLVYLNIKAY